MGATVTVLVVFTSTVQVTTVTVLGSLSVKVEVPLAIVESGSVLQEFQFQTDAHHGREVGLHGCRGTT